MKVAVIGHGSRTLTFARDEERDDNVVATLADGGLRAELRIEAGYIGYAGLGTFFAELDRAWRGWKGAIEFESLEHDLLLRATHRGHVMIDVRLRESTPDGWTASSTISVDPGEELSRIASAVADVISHGV